MTELPRIFHLQRDHDVSGVSGTGRVANGVLWPDGAVSLRWIGERPSTVHWDRLADVEHVHGQGGATRFVWADQPPPADAPAAECSAQNRNYEGGPRLCIRAAQHRGDHTDERGFHWSDTVAVYPVSDGTFRRGVDVRAELRRMADETQPAQPVTPMTVYLATPCAACDHTLNWHRNDVGCTVTGCVCGRFQEPAAGARQDGAQP